MSPARLSLAQLKAQSHAFDLGGIWRPFSVCRGRRQRKFFATPWTTATCRFDALARLDLGQRRGSSSWAGRRRELRAEARRHAARLRSLPVAGRAHGRLNASTPPRANSLRQRRTVSSRTLKASAMRGLVHPDNVSNIARARSASPRPREWANVSSACALVPTRATGNGRIEGRRIARRGKLRPAGNR